MRNKKWLLLFITVVICFAMPSIIYLAKNQSIYNFIYQWTFIFKIPKTILAKWINTISFIGLMSVMFILYILIIKHSNKIFKSKKQLIIAICIISVLFALIIPYTSTDVYSYIANGWSASHYHENPYYKSVGQISDEHQVRDQMYNKVANCWRYETVVYGPFWTLICKILTSISLGKIDVALAIFKGTNLIVHLINCLLIWEITHKKKFVLIYGANPTILFEALSNVHNDIFIVLFILLAIYFVTKKKNLMLSVAFIAMATAIKYLGILILPFIILYHLRGKNILEKIKYCVLYGLEFIVILAGFYAIYVRDLNIFAGLFIQQSKYNRSIMLVFYYLIGEQSTNILKTALLAVFAILYVYTVIKLLLNNNTEIFSSYIREYSTLLYIFTFILITNFNSWYILWLFPTLMFLNGKNIRLIINLSYAVEVAYIGSFALYSEAQNLGVLYIFLVAIVTGILTSVPMVKNKVEYLSNKIEIKK